MTIKLEVTTRDAAADVTTLRNEGGIPGVVYGPKQAALTVTVPAKVFDKIRKEASESTIIELTGLGESHEVLIKDVDFNPVKQEILHVDFYAIERGKDMTTHVPLMFVGESPAEQSRIGSVTKVLHEVEVTCRPSALPEHIEVDISALVTAEDKIHVSDLKVSSAVKIEADPDDVVAVIAVTKEESAVESSDVDMSAIEVEKKGKTEESTEAE